MYRTKSTKNIVDQILQTSDPSYYDKIGSLSKFYTDMGQPKNGKPNLNKNQSNLNQTEKQKYITSKFRQKMLQKSSLNDIGPFSFFPLPP